MSCLSVDIESTGKEIIAIGFFFSSEDEKIQKKITFARKVPDDKDFDADTLEWWKKYPEILKRIDKKAQEDKTETEEEMTKAVSKFVNSLEVFTEDGKKTQSILILTYHPS